MNVLSDKTNVPKRKDLTEWQIGGIVNCSRAGVKQSVICKTGDGIPRKRSRDAKALNKEGRESFGALKWCSGKANWGYDRWKYVVWSDESKFNIVGNDGDARVLRKEGERYDSNHVIKTTKFVIVLDAKVNQIEYIKCLQENYLPWISEMIEKEGTTFILQEDGTPGHTGKIARNWKNDQPEILGFDFWPAQSPDLNPIEHLWAILEKRIEGRRHAIGSKDELEACLRDEWSKLDVGLAEILVQSMPSRCKEVIKAKGGNTRY
ncbi:hypothetical protein [Parasitella parasitica]|uniref:Tc1-like transposase DDE domain-containing protein n=1 Tax=Parasitella parasitica TaxID=35722 RepID=A0A0B7MZY1_9FUNG|nr:hypothetical protein [Parasitella parasitica]